MEGTTVFSAALRLAHGPRIPAVLLNAHQSLPRQTYIDGRSRQSILRHADKTTGDQPPSGPIHIGCTNRDPIDHGISGREELWQCDGVRLLGAPRDPPQHGRAYRPSTIRVRDRLVITVQGSPPVIGQDQPPSSQAVILPPEHSHFQLRGQWPQRLALLEPLVVT